MNDANSEKREDTVGKVTTREIRPEDIAKLKPIIEAWVRDEKGELLTEEVNQIIDRIQKSITGQNDYHFLVAELSDRGVVGMVGYRPPEGQVADFVRTSKPAEGVNLFLSPDIRGQGVGRTLNSALIETLEQNGYTQFLFDSGPRYKESGWFFHDAHYPRIGLIPDRYGPGRDAPVWGVMLQTLQTIK